MKYFQYLNREEEQMLFLQPPRPFDRTAPRDMLAYAIGAALYMPATRTTIADDIVSGKLEGLVSMVLDLEDAVGDNQVALAEESLLQQMFLLSSYIRIGSIPLPHVPLIFIRVRSVMQLQRLMQKLENHLEWISGFVFPKFTPDNAEAYFAEIDAYNRMRGSAPVLYGMPILESPCILYVEERRESLLAIKRVLDRYRDCVLNVRIGATDFSSLFGVRRKPEFTIYDIAPIRDCIADIINVFGRVESAYVISGPVWEYFESRGGGLKPASLAALQEEGVLRAGRKGRGGTESRQNDGLIREVMLDIENGIIGKTIIHPSQIKPVQSLYTVTHEEYSDACSILNNHDGSLGVLRSEYGNKMNELKPHCNWAQKILIRAEIYGVLHAEQHFISLLPHHEHAYI